MTAATRSPGVFHAGVRPAVGLGISLALHVLVVTLAVTHIAGPEDKAEPPAREKSVTVLYVRSPDPQQSARPPDLPARAGQAPAALPPPVHVQEVPLAAPQATPRQAASMAAPPAPTAAEWAFAATYKLKNSKGYRHTWGRQVRSMMGTAVEGPDQGLVRFRIEIAPDGRLTALETLWSTSPVAERLARQAIASMPQWPPTPTGKPLVFEKTIAYSPFATDDPPLYKDDCLPDPPAFSNPFAWNGQSAGGAASARPVDERVGQPDPQALEDCLRQLPQDSIDAERARDRRLMEQWGWGASPLGR